MNQPTSTVDLPGALRSIPKSGQYLSPIYEAFTNAWEAINSKYPQDTALGSIDISLYFKLATQNAIHFLQIVIEDNGIGLDKTNFDRFNELFNTTKGKGNRGSGRIQYVHSFQNVYFDSCYIENSEYHERRFSYNKDNGKSFLGEDLFSGLCSKTKTGTTLTLSTLKNPKDQVYYNGLTAELLKNDLIARYVFKFYNNTIPQINIHTFINSEKKETISLSKQDIPQQKNEISFDVHKVSPKIVTREIETGKEERVEWDTLDRKETLTAINFQFPESVMKSNRITLYSQGVAVQNVSFSDIIKTREIIENSRFLTVIKGDFLDALPLSDDSRSSLKFDDKETVAEEVKQGNLFEPESKGYIFYDTLKKSIRDSLPRFYPILKKVEDKRDETIKDLAKTFNISERTIKKTSFDLADDTPEKILSKLYMTESKNLSKRDVKIKELFDNVNSLNPSDVDYLKTLEEKGRQLISLVPKQNAIELSSYIARREIIAHLLEKTLDQQTIAQQNIKKQGGRNKHEDLLHNIFVRKGQANSSESSALWILNEDYIYFSGYSDVRLKDLKFGEEKLFDNIEELAEKFGEKILADNKPDVCLFPEEGKCIIIEFKAPGVSVAKHITQIEIYAKLIANCIKPKFKIKQYYGYLIAEDVNKFEVPSRYISGVEDGTWFDPKIPINGINEEEQVSKGALYHEIIQWSALKNRAFARNRKFAEILGIREDLKKASENTSSK